MNTIPHEQKESRFKWWVLTLATGVQATATLVTYGVGPLAVYWQQEFDLSQARTGALISAVQAGPLLSMLWIGRALDQYGERWLIGWGSICLGVAMWTATLWDHYLGMILSLGLVGVCYGTAQPGGSNVVMKWFSPHERGMAMGIRQAGIPIGGAMAGVLVPVIAARLDWSWAVAVQSLLAIMGGVWFLAVYRDPPQQNKPKRPGEPFTKQLASLIRRKSLYPLLMTGFALVSLQMILVAHLMMDLSSRAKMPPVLAGQLLSVALLAGMIGRISLAWISDHVFKGNRMTPLQLTLWAAVAGSAALACTPGELPVGLWFALCSWLGFFGMGWYSLFVVQVAEESESHAAGFTVSYALTWNQIGIIAAPAVFGWLVDRMRYAGPWMVVTGFLCLSGIGLLLRSGLNKQRSRHGVENSKTVSSRK